MADIFEQVKWLRKLYNGFQSTRVLLTANNYRVFDHLTTPQTAGTISRKLNTELRATEILLDALTGLSLLKKQNSSYKNTTLASCFLVKGSPYYQGDIIRHSNTLWDNWSGLDKILKTGIPYRKSQNHEAFILGMHNMASLKANEVVRSFSLKGVKRALDLGGGPGTYAMKMTRKGVHVTLFDRTETISIARRLIKKEGIRNIDFIQGDFLYDDIGKGYDLIFISQVFHAYSEKDSISLLRKCRNSLNNNGRVVIQEFFINEQRTHPVQSALFSVNMLVNTEGGRSYSPQEIKSWFLKTGFKKITKKLVSDNLLMIAEK